ncbi:hypothetical protein [Anaeromicropila populeti]|uniref:Uncharacterized protein n=1 Tax=Anaeromicropila populeti TaxID=37658 RepID=A0A1I6J8D8_9FIRM|nr:hypothetical protein [Anaeromicropila populeti]SFR75214.1 hypothetical protein SAMN05661086_01449 [Anaeromicropila populeti]
MTGKNWTCSFVAIIIGVLLFIGGTNYFVDPFGYFTNKDGEYHPYSNTDGSYTRYIKAQYIANHPDDFDAYIVGGSKVGAISTESLSEMDGYHYYNMWLLSGNFREYELYISFILEHTSAKKIILHISGPEVRRFNREFYGDIYVTPAIVTGKSTLLESLEFLGKNLKTSLEVLRNRWSTKEDTKYYDLETGEINLNKYYDLMAQNRNSYFKNRVMQQYDQRLQQLFYVDRMNNASKSSLDAMKRIKLACQEKGVELVVIIGANAITELYEYEGESYWNYLEQIYSIFDGVWDFSGYNSVSMNPYNFYNESHYNGYVADKMLKIISGRDTADDFGEFVTAENAYEHLEKRKEAYYTLKEEFDATGTIDLSQYSYEERVQ